MRVGFLFSCSGGVLRATRAQHTGGVGALRYNGRNHYVQLKGCSVAELTDEQIAREEEFLEGIPRLNIAAFFLPPIWGPAQGLWASILFYPIWLFADNTFYAAFTERTVLSIVIALIVGVVLVGITVAFSLIGQPLAAHRAASRGVSKEDYLRRQRVWSIVCVIVGVIMLAAATYYNLVIRPTIGA